MPEKKPYLVRRFPLDTARLIESDDPIAIGDNYRELVNLRPGERHPRAVTGMTKITTAALTFSDSPTNRPAKIRNAIQFVKEEPYESHIVVEAYNYLESSLKLYRLDGTIPNTDTFNATALYTVADKWTLGTAYTKGSFVFPTTNNGYYYECIDAGTSDAVEPTWPTTELDTKVDNSIVWLCRKGSLHGAFCVTDTGELVYANSGKILIWPGDEHKVGAVVNCNALAWPLPDPVTNNMFDVTDAMLNTLTDDENLFFVTGLDPVAAVYDAYVYIGSPYQLRGIKPYILDPLAASSTGACTAGYWSGAAFTSIGVTDGTASGGHTLSQTGEITFASDTVGLAKTAMVFGRMLYWYKFKFETVPNSGTSRPIIYYLSILASMQPVTDIWDGTPVSLLAAWKNPSADKYYDIATNVANFDDVMMYGGAGWLHLPSASVKISSFTSSDSLYLGSGVRLCGFKIMMSKDQYNDTERNTNSATISIKYFDGKGFTTVSYSWDGTAQSGKSLWQSGIVMFTPPSPSAEFKTSINNDSSFYYYEISWSATLSGDVWIDQILGIPAPITLTGQERAFSAQGRLFLVKGNNLSCSPVNRPTVHNGSEHASFNIGDDTDITGGGQLFNIQGSDYRSPILVFKKTATYLLDGTGPSWVRHDLSMFDGLAAPDTLCIINLPISIPGLASTIAMGQGTRCVFICDGHAPRPVTKDIEQYFDPRSADCIPANMIDKSVSFIDYENLEYHWLFASGSGQTTLNKEMVFSLKETKWFEIQRENSILQFGFGVVDQYRRKYSYGTCDDGHVKRLEYGTSFDGEDITCIMWPADITMTEDKTIETKVENVQAICMAKTVTVERIGCNHYLDGSLTPMKNTQTQISPTAAGKRIANAIVRLRTPSAVFHATKMTFICDDEVTAFEPIDLLWHYEIEEQRVRPMQEITSGPFRLTLPSSETKLTTPDAEVIKTPG